MAYSNSCQQCVANTPLPKKTRITPIQSNATMERLVIDLKEYEMYVDHNDGYKYLLCVVDHFSNYPWTFPLRTKETKNVVDALESIFFEFGLDVLPFVDSYL